MLARAVETQNRIQGGVTTDWTSGSSTSTCVAQETERAVAVLGVNAMNSAAGKSTAEQGW